jgi:hypothetical protein
MRFILSLSQHIEMIAAARGGEYGIMGYNKAGLVTEPEDLRVNFCAHERQGWV